MAFPVISWAAGSFHRELSRSASRLGACFRKGKISGLPCRFQLPILAGLGNAKFLKKALARGQTFDILFAPFRSEGRMVSMVAGR
jgi:hypothetical protein